MGFYSCQFSRIDRVYTLNILETNSLGNPFGRAATLAIFVAASPLSAEGIITSADRQLMMDVLGIDPGRKPFDYSAPKYLKLFRQNSFDGELGYSPRDRELQMLAWLAKVRSGLLENFFAEDLNDDLTISTDEMRVRLVYEAYNYIHPEFENDPPSLKDIEGYIAEKTKSDLRNDLDGDGAISFDEMRILVHDLVENARHRPPTPHMSPSLLHDTDGDGTISEDEFLDLAQRIHSFFDTDSDGRISPQERVAAHKMIKTPPSFMLTTPAKDTPACKFPDQGGLTDYYVIGGYEGSAMTDVYFGDTPKAVELVDIRVPVDGKEIYLIASFYNDTILRLNDPSERVRAIYGTRGRVGVIGAPEVKIVQTDLSCHLSLWKQISPQNPDPESFYEPYLKHAPIGVLKDYSLGLIDIGTMTNAPRKRLHDSEDIDIAGKHGMLWTQFVRFNPGGLVLLDPEQVQFSGKVSRHKVWPQYAGLAQLADSGVLKVLPRDGRNKQVRGSWKSVIIDSKRFRLNGGDDSITRNGFVYTLEKPDRWVGRAPLQLRVERTFDYPAGLSGAHAVTFILPSGIAEPHGQREHSDLIHEDPNINTPAEEYE